MIWKMVELNKTAYYSISQLHENQDSFIAQNAALFLQKVLTVYTIQEQKKRYGKL